MRRDHERRLGQLEAATGRGPKIHVVPVPSNAPEGYAGEELARLGIVPGSRDLVVEIVRFTDPQADIASASSDDLRQLRDSEPQGSA